MTDLQKLYDSFFTKVQRKDIEPSFVYGLVDPAIAKVYKQFTHDYTYVLTDSETYDGYFIDDMNIDEIELIALQMAIDYHTGKDLDRLITLQTLLGTKDFCKLPSYKDNLAIVQNKLNSLQVQLEKLKSDMNTYSK